MESRFDKLNPQQKKAVQTVDGRVLILAGAGSGKTHVLTMRMAHLIKNLKVSPKAILGLTFTNKAAAEMRHRMGSLIEAAAAKQITLCTFHSFCMKLLREEIHHLGYTANFTLYDEKEVERLIVLIARDILKHEGELPSLAHTIAAIRSAKNKGLSPEEIVETGSHWHDGFTREVYTRLHASMRAYNAVDFDNLLWLSVELFERFPDVLDKYQEQYRYLMIDEYQDTNPIQYRLAALLSGKYHNLCVVGDDDQSIYGWRGADVKNILEFERAVVIKLEQNYRSTNSILKAANAVISKNTKRHDKVLWSHCGEGNLIEVFTAANELEEAESVVRRIAKMRESQGFKWKDIAILYRSNALSRQLETALLKHTWKLGEGKLDDRWIQGIPYQIFGGLEFYERREIKDLCAYLRVIVNPLDEEALLRVINHPRRGIGEGTLDHLTAYNRKHHIPLWEVLKDSASGIAQGGEMGAKTGVETSTLVKGKALEGIRRFVHLIETAQDKFAAGSLLEPMQWMVDAMDYRRAIKDEVKSDQMRDFKWENVQEFMTAMAEFEKDPEREGKISLQAFVTDLPLENQPFQNKQGKEQDDKVSLMTIHSAKGLEFPVCFIVGAEDHLIPHEKSMEETGLEEERRLMYVAITRAKRHLIISMARQRKRLGKDYPSLPSRFLFEIPKELLNPTNP
jgi:DNA helicase II / ATP-dependent DNA helicase PcrA